MSKAIQILMVEDSEADALLVTRELKRSDMECACVRVETAAEMEEALRGGGWDIVISDYSLPQFTGLHAFKIFKKANLDIPFILVSGTIGEEVAVEAMKSGVNDYILKSNIKRLAPAVRRELRDSEERNARRRAESRLRETEQLRAVGELTASLMHDLKNPLQSILSSAELANSEYITAEARAKYCKMIERQVERLVRMSQEILDFVRGEVKLHVTPVNLCELLSEMTETYAPVFARDGVWLSWNETTNCATAVYMLDREKIWRAMLNLLSNAKDAMPDGGEIKLSVGRDRNQVIIEISDTGPGIPEEIKDSLFEPFITHGKTGGTGLGLAIVKKLVDVHGGTIRYISSPGMGTTFRIALSNNDGATQTIKPVDHVEISA